MINKNDSKLILFARQGLILVLLFFTLFLAGCGNSVTVENVSVTLDQDKKGETPLVESVTFADDSITIDLNLSQEVSFDVVTHYDDDSQTTSTFTATWNTDTKSLVVTDGSNSPVSIEYDAEALTDASGNGTSLVISDDLFPENIEITFVLIPSNSLNISIILPQPLLTAFYVDDSVQLNVNALVDSETVENILSYVTCSSEDESFFLGGVKFNLTSKTSGPAKKGV